MEIITIFMEFIAGLLSLLLLYLIFPPLLLIFFNIIILFARFLKIKGLHRFVPIILFLYEHSIVYTPKSFTIHTLSKIISKGKHLKNLIKDIKDSEFFVRILSAWALGNIGDKQSVDLLIALLHDDSSIVRKSAAEILGEIGNARSVEPLIAALHDEDQYVRGSAAWALGKTGDVRAVEPLIAALRDEDWHVSYSAADALEKIRPDWRTSEEARNQVPAFIKALNDNNESVRESAAWILGEIGDTRAVEPLIAALWDEDWHVCNSAADALEKIRPDWRTSEEARNQVPAFIKALNDNNESVRASAAWALGEIGDTRAVEPLIAALRDEDWHVHGSAAWALGKIGDTRAVEPLIAALRDEDWPVRHSAPDALGKIGDVRAVEPLIAALRDRDWYVSYSAADALGKIGDVRAVEPLIAVLQDEDWFAAPRDEDLFVRESAAIALGEIGDERAIKPLLKFIKPLKIFNRFIRKAAFDSLRKIVSRNKDSENIIRNIPYFRKVINKNDINFKKILDQIESSQHSLYESYPDLFCKKCYLRAEQRMVRYAVIKSYTYIVCRGCNSTRHLMKGIRKVFGIIGSQEEWFREEGDSIYLNIWDEKTKQVRNADIDVLLIKESPFMGTSHHYDYAIDAVYNALLNDTTRPRDYIRKIPVEIHGNPPLSERALRILENEFGGIKRRDSEFDR